jgi:hypothetical protein
MNDLLACPLAEFVRFWPRPLRRQVEALGVGTVGELLQLSRIDILMAPGLDHELLSCLRMELSDHLGEPGTNLTARDVDAFLARQGPTRPLPEPRPAPLTSWGCLYARWESRLEPSGHHGDTADLAAWLARVAPSATLAEPEPDLILVDGRGPGRWYSVQSRRWEHASPGRNPLALALSTLTTVIGIGSVAGKYSELAIYREGHLAQISVRGLHVPAEVPGAAEVDAEWLGRLGWDADPGIRLFPELFGRYQRDASMLARLLGFRARGFSSTWRALGREARGVSLVHPHRDATADTAAARLEIAAEQGISPVTPGRSLDGPGTKARPVSELALFWLIAALDRLREVSWRFQIEPLLGLEDGGASASLDSLAGWRMERVPGGMALDEPGLPLPDFCSEVLTAERSAQIRTHWLPLLARAGVPWVWLIDPLQHRIEVYASREGVPVLVTIAPDRDGSRLPPPFASEPMVAPWWTPRFVEPG